MCVDIKFGALPPYAGHLKTHRYTSQNITKNHLSLWNFNCPVGLVLFDCLRAVPINCSCIRAITIKAQLRTRIVHILLTQLYYTSNNVPVQILRSIVHINLL